MPDQTGAVLTYTAVAVSGRVLAASDQIRTIFAEPRVIKEPKETSTRLAPVLDMGAHEICKHIVDSNNPGYAVLKIHATEAECLAAQGANEALAGGELCMNGRRLSRG